MGDFKRGGGGRFGGNRGGGGFSRRNGGGRPSFSRGGRGDSDGRGRGPVTMHKAVCSQCGKDCEVPFRPTGDKPVYCNDCFGDIKGTGDNRGGDRFQKKSFDSYRAPVRADFSGGVSGGSNDNSEVKKQLELLNVKMDRLIKTVESIAGAGMSLKEKITEEKMEAETGAVKKKTKKVFKAAKK